MHLKWKVLCQACGKLGARKPEIPVFWHSRHICLIMECGKIIEKTTRSIGFKRLPFFHIFCLAPEEVFQADEVACQMRCANGDSHSGFHGLSWLSGHLISQPTVVC